MDKQKMLLQHEDWWIYCLVASSIYNNISKEAWIMQMIRGIMIIAISWLAIEHQVRQNKILALNTSPHLSKSPGGPKLIYQSMCLLKIDHKFWISCTTQTNFYVGILRWFANINALKNYIYYHRVFQTTNWYHRSKNIFECLLLIMQYHRDIRL